jgi:hypothetical protein
VHERVGELVDERLDLVVDRVGAVDRDRLGALVEINEPVRLNLVRIIDGLEALEAPDAG